MARALALLGAGCVLAAQVAPPAAGATFTQAAGGPQITEVRAAAGRGSQDAAFEWVEIHNPGPAPIDLTGWSLADNRGEDPIPATTLGAGAYLIVGGSAALAEELPADLQLVAVADGRIGNGLANSGDRVLLIDPSGTAVDGVSWGSDRTILVLAPPPSGQTLSRSGGEWSAATASPGAAHRAERVGPPAEATLPLPPLRITEIFASAGMGSREAAFEWVEVSNAGEEPVDLTGWTIADNAAVDELPGGVVAPGAYVTIGGSAEAADGTVDVVLEDGRIGNGLANRGDVVTLRDPLGRVVDEVDYRAPPIPLPEVGRSIALSGDIWVLNGAPSPGSDGVTPPPAEAEAPAPAQAPAVDEVAAETEEEEDAAAAALPLAALRITEIFASTGMGSREAAFEWVEVFNAGAEPVDLTGWTIADNAAVDELPGGVVAPGAHLTIGGSAEAADGAVDVALEDGRIGNGLANRGDVVTLRDPVGRVVDEVDYRASPIPLPESGRSIALSGDVWVLNTVPSPGSDGVTPPPPPPPEEESPDPPEEPAEADVVAGDDVAAEDDVAREEDDDAAADSGAAEEVAVEDADGADEDDAVAAQDEERSPAEPPPPLEITEIFANAGEGSRDAAFEWVEIHNAGTTPIDLAGWTIGDNGATDDLRGFVIAPGARLTIGGSTEAADGGVDIVVEDGRIGNGLANSGDVVVLRDPQGRIVDEVDYRVPPIPAPEAGRSIALTEAGWVLNTAPSPGSDGVTPLLASLLTPPATSPEEPADAPQGVAANDDAAEDGGGVPATLLVVVAIGVPLAAIAVRQALRRRRPSSARSDERPGAQEEHDD